MYVLSIECSTLVGGVSLTFNDRILATESWSEHSRQGEFVIPGIQKLFKSAGISASQLDRIAVDIGPGRFTGVRVAINAARTLAYSLDLPVVAFDSLSLLAAGCPPESSPVLAIINAHKNMVYAAIFSQVSGKWACTREPAAMTIPELSAFITEPHTCVGDGYSVYEPVFNPALKQLLRRQPELSDHPLVQTLAQLAISASPKSWKQIEPLYIRGSEAEEKLKAGLITGFN